MKTAKQLAYKEIERELLHKLGNLLKHEPSTIDYTWLGISKIYAPSHMTHRFEQDKWEREGHMRLYVQNIEVLELQLKPHTTITLVKSLTEPYLNRLVAQVVQDYFGGVIVKECTSSSSKRLQIRQPDPYFTINLTDVPF